MYSGFHSAFWYEVYPDEHAAGSFIIAQAVERRLCGDEGEGGGTRYTTLLCIELVNWRALRRA